MPGKNRVAYVWDPDCKTAWYGQGHPMKPQRLSMTHELVQGYGMLSGQLGCGMQVVRPVPATKEYTTLFHSQQYMDFLETVTEEAMSAAKVDQQKFTKSYKFSKKNIKIVEIGTSSLVFSKYHI